MKVDGGFILNNIDRQDCARLCLCSFLLSGDIPDLFSDEEVDMIVTSMRMELRGLGLIDSRDNCWSFFIERIRRQLKVGCFQCGSQSAALPRLTKVRPVCHLQVVLCFSPVGFTLRTRARKFPALVNCTAIDWFHPWPQLALQSVSTTFIEKIPGLEVTASTCFVIALSCNQLKSFFILQFF